METSVTDWWSVVRG